MKPSSKSTTSRNTEIGCGTALRPPRPEHKFPDETMLARSKQPTPTCKPTPTAHHYLCCPKHKERCLAYNGYIQPIGDSRALLNFMHKHVGCNLAVLANTDKLFPEYRDY